MQPITYTEFGIKMIATEYFEVGPEFLGMTNLKPFAKDGSIYMNKDKRLFEVTSIYFETLDGTKLERNQVALDTTTRVGAVIFWQSKVLIIKRVLPDYTYSIFPGGHMREDENLDEALERELLEETGLEADDFSKIFEQQKENMGREVYFKIVLEKEPNLRAEDPDDSTRSFVFVAPEELSSIENLFPQEIIPILTHEQALQSKTH